ncbi:MAG: HEAT repeat domain-containing protein [Deltaproteobacteria bacterium]|nr:HEAT repeat domain-containing protein [Deltaproteobacteria bacterium]
MDFTQSNALLSTDLEAIIAAASDPAAELERLAGSLEGEIATFRQWLADSLQRQEDLPRLIEEEKAKIDKCDATIEKARARGREDIEQTTLTRKKQLEELVSEMEDELDFMDVELETARGCIDGMEGLIAKIEAKRQQLAAAAEIAAADAAKAGEAPEPEPEAPVPSEPPVEEPDPEPLPVEEPTEAPPREDPEPEEPPKEAPPAEEPAPVEVVADAAPEAEAEAAPDAEAAAEAAPEAEAEAEAEAAPEAAAEAEAEAAPEAAAEAEAEAAPEAAAAPEAEAEAEAEAAAPQPEPIPEPAPIPEPIPEPEPEPEPEPPPEPAVHPFFLDELDQDALTAALESGDLAPDDAIAAFAHEDAAVRRNVALALGVLADLPDVGPDAARALATDPDERVRALVVAAVTHGHDLELALPLLFDALADAARAVADAAAAGVEARLEADPKAVVSYLVLALGDVRPAAAAVATDLLVKAGDDAVPALVAALSDPSPVVRRATFQCLERLRARAAKALLRAAGDAVARAAVIELLSGLDAVDDDLRAALDDLAKTGDAVAADTARKVLRAHEPPAEAAGTGEPLDIPIAGFMTEALGDDALDAAASADVPRADVVQALRDGRPHVRRNALGLLARDGGAPLAADALTGDVAALAKDAEPAVRAAAARTLAHLGGGPAVATLVLLMGDLDATVAQAAADAFAGLGPEAVDLALDALRVDQPARVHSAAARALAKVGDAAVPRLADALRERQSGVVREVAAQALGALGPAAEDALAALLSALGDSLEVVRLTAAWAIGRVGVDDDTVLAALRDAQKDPVAAVRRRVAETIGLLTGKPLGQTGAAESRPVPIDGFEDGRLGKDELAAKAPGVDVDLLVHALHDGRDHVRANAATALGALGDVAAPAVNELGLALRDGSPDVREAAIAALDDLGLAAVPAAFWLVGALSDPLLTVRARAVAILKALHAQVADFLVEGLRADPEIVPATVGLVFEELGPDGIPTLVDALRSASALIRRNAVTLLGALGEDAKGAAVDVLPLLEDEDEAVRKAAARALKWLEEGVPGPPLLFLDERPLPFDGFDSQDWEIDELEGRAGDLDPDALGVFVHDGRLQVRKNAARSLGALKLATEGLAIRLKDGDLGMRRASASALERAGEAALPFAAQVVEALHDKDGEVHAACHKVLLTLGEKAESALIGGLDVSPDRALRTIIPVFADLEKRGIPALTLALDHKGAFVRLNAVHALGKLRGFGSEDLVEKIAERLKEPMPSMKTAALQAIRFIVNGPDEVAELEALAMPLDGFDTEPLDEELLKASKRALDEGVLARLLNDGREQVRENAARALGVLHEVPPGLVVRLKDEAPAVRRAAIKAIAANAEEAAPYADAVLQALGDRDDEVRETASRAAYALWEHAKPALVRALDQAPERAAVTILPVFEDLGEDALETLVAAARESASARVQANAILALERLGDDALAALDGIAKDMGADATVRLLAAGAVQRIEAGEPAPPWLEPMPMPVDGFDTMDLDHDTLKGHKRDLEPAELDLFIHDGRAKVRVNAARALGVLGEPTGGLAIRMKDGTLAVKRAAAAALAMAGDAALPYALPLVQALNDADPEVRESAHAALKKLGPAAREALLAGLDLSPDKAQRGIVALFEDLGGDGIDVLEEALSHPSAHVRLNAVHALSRLRGQGSERLIDKIRECGKEPMPSMRQAAALAIYRLTAGEAPPRALEPTPLPFEGFDAASQPEDELKAHRRDLDEAVLARFLNDGRPFVRENAARALGVLKEAPVQLALALKDELVEVRRAAAKALAAAGGEAGPWAIPMLAAMADPDAEVRDTVKAALVELWEPAQAALLGGLDRPPERAARVVFPVVDAVGADAIPFLTDALRHYSTYVQLNAIAALERIGEAAVPALEAVKDDGEASAVSRHAAGRALSRLLAGEPAPRWLEPIAMPVEGFDSEPLEADALKGHKRDLDERDLERLLHDGRPIVRENAARALGVLGEASPGLAVRLKDEVVAVRRAAAGALKALGSDGAPFGDALVGALGDADAEVRRTAHEALVALGKDGYDALIAGLDAPADRAAVTVLPIFWELGKPALVPLEEALGHVSTRIRVNAVHALGAMKEHGAAKLEEALREQLATPEQELRRAALLAIFRLTVDAPEAPNVLPEVALPLEGFDLEPLDEAALKASKRALDEALLRALVSDGRRRVRENAARALGVLGDVSLELALRLKDEDVLVRRAAATAIASAGGEAKSVAPSLVAALGDRDEAVRETALGTLVALGKDAFDALILGLDTSPDRAAGTTLRAIDALGEKALPVLEEALDHVSTHVRLNALHALGMLHERGAKKLLAKIEAAVKDPLPSMSRAALLAIYRITIGKEPPRHREAVPMPVDGFDAEPLDAKKLGAAAKEMDVAWLEASLADGRPMVRLNAARALGALGKKAEDQVPAVVLALRDSDDAVRVAAAEALAVMSPDPWVAAPGLARALRGASAELEAAVLGALDAIGAKKAVPPLIEALHDREDWVVASIGRAARHAPDAFVKPLAEVVGSDEANLVQRENAIVVLGELGEAASGAEKALLAALDDTQGMITVKALRALAWCAKPGPALVKALNERLAKEPRPSVHYATRETIRRLKARQATAAVSA